MSGKEEKTRTAFECAAAYVLCRERERGEIPGWILVLDMDAYTAGLCACDASGSIALMGDVRVDGLPPDSFLEELERLAGAGARVHFTGQERRGKRSYYNYLMGERETDLTVYDGVTCSQLERAFARNAEAFRRLFLLAEDLLRQKKADEGDLRILLVGSMARNYLAEHLARGHFSIDPFLPDPLFWTADEEDDPALFAQKGWELYQAGAVQESGPIGRHIVLMLLDRENSRVPIDLAQPEQSRVEFETPAYSPPFLYCCGEPICLEVDGARQEITVPQSFFPAEIAAGMLRAAVVLREGELCLSVCGADAPRHERHTPITIS